jgi:hypothetical protein
MHSDNHYGSARKKKKKNNKILPESNKISTKLLEKLYTDISSASPALYTSREPLYREAKKHLPSITREKVKEFLTSLPVYTKHRRVVRSYPRLPTTAPGLHTIWQCDLSDMQKLSSDN